MSYEAPPGAPHAVPNSNMALISLIAGILGLTFFPLIGSIVAVITGPMAKKEIQESNGMLGGEGMATAGQVMGWIGLGLSALGLCVAGVIIAFTMCLIPMGIMSEGSFLILPGLLGLF